MRASTKKMKPIEKATQEMIWMKCWISRAIGVGPLLTVAVRAAMRPTTCGKHTWIR